MTAEGRVVFRAATDPVIAGEGVSGSSIKGVIAHRDLLPLNLRIPESVRPVIDVVDLYPSARRDLGRSLGRSGQSKNQKIFIISNRSLRPLPCPSQPGTISFFWILSQCWVARRVVNLVQIMAEAIVELCDRPYGLALWVHRFGDLANVSSDLRIPKQIVNELSIRGTILWRSPLCGAELGAPHQTLVPLGFSRT